MTDNLQSTARVPGSSETEPKLTYEFKPEIVPCFLPTTRIATPSGERFAKDLYAGDPVLTRDNGIQNIQWVGGRSLNAAELRENPALQPVRILRGAFGRNMPSRDLVVSPSHRILVTEFILSSLQTKGEHLVDARDLVGLPGISFLKLTALRYIHLMLDQHQVVLSDGAWTESYRPQYQTMCGMEERGRHELLALFPELHTARGFERFTAARPNLTPDRTMN